MMSNNFFVKMVIAIAFMLSIPTVQAESWYVGGGFGVARVDGLCSKGAPQDICDSSGGVVRAVAGWRMNRNFAIEGVVQAAGEFLSPSARTAGFDGKVNNATVGVNAIGFIPLSSRVSLFAGASGAFSYTTIKVSRYRYGDSSQDCDWHYDWYDDNWDYYCRNRYSNSDNNYDYESKSSVAAGGLAGVDVRFSKRTYIRAQAQRLFNVDGGLAFGSNRDLDFVTVNFLMGFH